MSYSTGTTIMSLLPGVPNTTTWAGHTETVILIDLHITRADTLINSKISARYEVANFVTNVPPVLRMIAEDITSYWTLRSMYQGDTQNDNEWTDKYKDSITFLNEIRDSKIDLVNTAGSIIQSRTIASVDKIESNTMDYQPFFDEDKSTNWKVDNDKLSSIEDDRK